MFNSQRFFRDADAPISPAAAMASSGVLNITGTPTPTTTQELPATPPTADPAVANTAEPTEPVAEVKAEPQTPPAQTVIAEKPWREVLKSQKPEEVLNEYGLDDKTVKLAQRLAKADPKMHAFFDTWESKGDVNQYLKALSLDYEKMAPADVMRDNLRSQNPELSDEDFEDLYDLKVVERYKLDPNRFTEDEVRRGKIELAADSKPIRSALSEARQKLLLPDAPAAVEDPRIAEFEKLKQQQASQVETYKKSLLEDPYIKNVYSTKQITIGTGDEAFHYKVNPDRTTPILYDGAALGAAMQTDGKDDVQKQYLIAEFAADPYGFLAEHAKHFKALGGKSVVDPIANALPPGQTPAKSETTPSNPAEAMAKSGRLVTR